MQSCIQIYLRSASRWLRANYSGSAHVAGELHVRPKRSMLGDRRFALHSDSSDLTSSFGAAITSTTSDHSRHIDISRRRLRNKNFIEQCRRLVSEKHNPTYRIMSNLRDRWWQEACNCFLVDNFNDGTAGIGKSAILLPGITLVLFVLNVLALLNSTDKQMLIAFLQHS